MRDTSQYFARTAIILATTALVGTSAFADSRHPKTTVGRVDSRGTIEGRRYEAPAGETRRPRASRPIDDVRDMDADSNAHGGGRGYGEHRNRDRNHDGRSHGGSNNGNHHGQSNGGWNNGQHHGHGNGGSWYGRGQPYYSHGRISSVRPYGGGYRVWIYGTPYPFYVPSAYYRRGYFNVGMTVRVGGYYNSQGWYDYYGDYQCDAVSEKRMRGFVDSVDHREGEFQLVLDGGRTITVNGRDGGTRVCEGDYVLVYGDWNWWGSFVARDIDVIERGGRR